MFTINSESEALTLVSIFSSQSDGIANTYLTNLLETSIKQDFPKVFDQLVADPRVDVAANNNNAIILACKWNRINMVEKLLADARVDPSASSNAAIKEACLDGREKIVNMLLKNPKVDSENGIVLATYNHHTNIVRVLLEDTTRKISDNFLYDAINGALYHNNDYLVKLLIPHIDLSKINNKTILRNAAAMEEENMTDEHFSKKLNEMMKSRNVKGVFINDKNQTILIKDDSIVTIP